jgi:hypothetical protein
MLGDRPELFNYLVVGSLKEACENNEIQLVIKNSQGAGIIDMQNVNYSGPLISCTSQMSTWLTDIGTEELAHMEMIATLGVTLGDIRFLSQKSCQNRNVPQRPLKYAP